VASKQPKKKNFDTKPGKTKLAYLVMKNSFNERKTFNLNLAGQYAVRNPPTFLVLRPSVLPALARQATGAL